MKTPLLFKKTVSAALAALIFLMQAVLANAAETNIWAERRKTVVPPVTKTLPIPPLSGLSSSTSSADAVALAVAVTGGRLSWRHRSSGSPVAVVLQDVHANPEAQAGARALIGRLSEHPAFRQVALEGAFGPADVAAFQSFPDRQSLVRSIDFLLASGTLSGATAAALGSARSLALVGVDDKSLYEANVRAYLDSRDRRAEAEQALDRVDAGLAAERIPDPLRRFDAAAREYQAGRLPLGRYLAALRRAAGVGQPDVDAFLRALDMEARLDTASIERERARALARLGRSSDVSAARDLLADTVEFRAGRLTNGDYHRRLRARIEAAGIPLDSFPAFRFHLDYIEAADALDADRLFEGIHSLEDKAYARLAADESSRRWATRSRLSSLARRLVRFELSPGGWTRYRGLSRTPGGVAGFPSLKTFERFYLSAAERDDAIAGNIVAASGGHAAGVVAVVGGFHAPGIAERLGDAGWTVALVTPRLTRPESVEGAAYLAAFAREKTPLEKLFAPERLFVAPDPLAGAAALPVLTAAVRVHDGISSDPTEDLRRLAPRARVQAASAQRVADRVRISVTSDDGSAVDDVAFSPRGAITGLAAVRKQASAASRLSASGAAARAFRAAAIVVALAAVATGEWETALVACLVAIILPDPASAAGRVLLYVDGDGARRAQATSALGNLGFRILSASSAAEALEILESKGDRISLVIAQDALPDARGLELFREARQAPGGANISWTVISERDRDELRELGLPDYVPVWKPGEPFAGLIGLVGTALRDAGKPVVLHIEDSPSYAASIKLSLQSAGYRVTTAASGQEALRRLLEDPGISLILSDIDLPDFNGNEIWQIIQSEDSLRGKPFVVLSSRSENDRRELGIPADVPWFTKNFDFARLAVEISLTFARLSPRPRFVFDAFARLLVGGGWTRTLLYMAIILVGAPVGETYLFQALMLSTAASAAPHLAAAVILLSAAVFAASHAMAARAARAVFRAAGMDPRRIDDLAPAPTRIGFLDHFAAGAILGSIFVVLGGSAGLAAAVAGTSVVHAGMQIPAAYSAWMRQAQTAGFRAALSERLIPAIENLRQRGRAALSVVDQAGKAAGRVFREAANVMMTAVVLTAHAVGVPSTRFTRRWVPLPPQVEFLSGAGEVGANATIVRVAGKTIVVDAGLNIRDEQVPDFSGLTDAPDAVVVTHAHTDHIGGLPVLHKRFPRAPIYASPATLRIMKTMLPASMRSLRKHGISQSDIHDTLRAVIPIETGERYGVGPQAWIRLIPAGHLLGARTVEVGTLGGHVVVTGDIQTEVQRTVGAATAPRGRPDILVSESTMGDRPTPPRAGEERRFVKLVAETLARGGNAIIPSLALGRAQEVLIILRDAQERGDLPANTIFYDGMIEATTQAYEDALEDLPAERRAIVERNGGKLYAGTNVNIRRTPDGARAGLRRQMAGAPGPGVVMVAPAGMLNGGHILDYLQAGLTNPLNTVFFVNYQPTAGLGERIMNAPAESTVNINRQPVVKRATVEKISLSAHAGAEQLVRYLLRARARRDGLALVHGHVHATSALATHPKLAGLRPLTPNNGETLDARRPPLLRSLWRLVVSIVRRSVPVPLPPDLRAPDNMLVFTRAIHPFGLALAGDVHHDTGKFRARYVHTAAEPKLWGTDIVDRIDIAAVPADARGRDQLRALVRSAVRVLTGPDFADVRDAAVELGARGRFSADDLAARVNRSTLEGRLGAAVFLMAFPEHFDANRGYYVLKGALPEGADLLNQLRIRLYAVLGEVQPDEDRIARGAVVLVDSRDGVSPAIVVGPHDDGGTAAFRSDRRVWAPRPDKTAPRVEVPFQLGRKEGRVNRVIGELAGLLSDDPGETARRFRAFMRVAEELLPGDARHVWLMVQSVAGGEEMTLDELAEALLTDDAETRLGLRERYRALLAPRTSLPGGAADVAAHNDLARLAADQVEMALRLAVAVRMQKPAHYLVENRITGSITPITPLTLSNQHGQALAELDHEIAVYGLPLGAEITLPAGSTIHLHNLQEPRVTFDQPTSARLTGKFGKYVSVLVEHEGRWHHATLNIKRVRILNVDETPELDENAPTDDDPPPPAGGGDGGKLGVSFLFGGMYERSGVVGRALIAFLAAPVSETVLIGAAAAASVFLPAMIAVPLVIVASGALFVAIHPRVFRGTSAVPQTPTRGDRLELFLEGALYGAMFALMPLAAVPDPWFAAFLTAAFAHAALNAVSWLDGGIVGVGAASMSPREPDGYWMNADERRSAAGEEVLSMAAVIERTATARGASGRLPDDLRYPLHNLLEDLAAHLATTRTRPTRRMIRDWLGKNDGKTWNDGGRPLMTPAEHRRLARDIFRGAVGRSMAVLRRSAQSAILVDFIADAFERRDPVAFRFYTDLARRRYGTTFVIPSVDARAEWFGFPILREPEFQAYIDGFASRIPAAYSTNRLDAATTVRTILYHTAHSHDRVSLLVVEPELSDITGLLGPAEPLAASARLSAVNNRWVVSPASRLNGDGSGRHTNSYKGPGVESHGGVLRTRIRILPPASGGRPGYPGALVGEHFGGSNSSIEIRLDDESRRVVRKIAPARDGALAEGITADEARAKLRSEAAVMRELWDEGLRFLPRIDRVDEDGSETIVSMEDLGERGFVPAASFFFFDYYRHVPSSSIWDLSMRILDTLSETIYRKTSSPTPPDFVESQRIEHVRRRLRQAGEKAPDLRALFDRQLVVTLDRHGRMILPRFEALVPFIRAVLPYVTPPSLRRLMGDFHLGNILIDPIEFDALGRFESFQLLDWNARPNDYIYDFAKLIHSFYGRYELIRLRELYGFTPRELPPGAEAAGIAVYEEWFEDEEMNPVPLTVTANLTDIFIEWFRGASDLLGIEGGSQWKARLLFTHAIAMLGLPPYHMEAGNGYRQATGLYLMGMQLLVEALDLIINGAFDDGLPDGFPTVPQDVRDEWNGIFDQLLARTPAERPTSLATHRFRQSRIDEVRALLDSEHPENAVDVMQIFRSIDMGTGAVEGFSLLGRYLSAADRARFIRAAFRRATGGSPAKMARSLGMDRRFRNRSRPVRDRRPAFIAVTLNPVVDATMAVGFSFHGEDFSVHAGGKGVNMARALREWTGREPLALGFIGGDSGAVLAALMEKDGVPTGLMTVNGAPTRLSLAPKNLRSSGDRFAGPSPTVSASALREFRRAFAGNVRAGDIVLIGGSLPDGVPADEYARLVAESKRAGATVYVDTRGEALRRAVDALPDFVGINLAELAEAAGVDADELDNNRAAVARIASDWVRRGVRTVVVTMGGDGIVMVDRADGGIRAWHARSPKVDVVDANGAGDTVKVAFAHAEMKGYSRLEALKLAASGGAATVEKPGAAMATLREAEKRFYQIELTEMPVPAASPVGVSILFGGIYGRAGPAGRAAIALAGAPVVESILIGVLFGLWAVVVPASPWLAWTVVPLASGLFFAAIHPRVFDGLNPVSRVPSRAERAWLFFEGALYGALLAGMVVHAPGIESWIAATITNAIFHAMLNGIAIREGDMVSVAGGAESIVERARRLLDETDPRLGIESIDGRISALENAASRGGDGASHGEALLGYTRFVTGGLEAPEPVTGSAEGVSVILIDWSMAPRLAGVVSSETSRIGPDGGAIFIAADENLAAEAERLIPAGARAAVIVNRSLFVRVRGGSTVDLAALSAVLARTPHLSGRPVSRVAASDAVAFDASGLGTEDALRRAVFVVLSALGSVVLSVGQLDRLAGLARLAARQA